MNYIWIDTEFTDFINSDLISIGACTQDTHFYGENLQFRQNISSKWVKEHVYPLLNPVEYGMRKYALSAKLWEWIDNLPQQVYTVVADYETDFSLLDDLFGGEKHPKISGYLNIKHHIYATVNSYAAIVSASESEYRLKADELNREFTEQFLAYFHRTNEIQHHALSDAKANMQAHLHFIKNTQNLDYFRNNS